MVVVKKIFYMISKYKIASVGNWWAKNGVDKYLDYLVNTFAVARIAVKNYDADEPPNR